jgi:hypothetical protein
MYDSHYELHVDGQYEDHIEEQEDEDNVHDAAMSVILRYTGGNESLEWADAATRILMMGGEYRLPTPDGKGPVLRIVEVID